MTESTFNGWAILEQMGHRRTAGYVTSETLFGVAMGRIDIPRGDGTATTCYFSGGSVFALTPCTEEIARGVAARNQPEPVSPYELPKARRPALAYDDDRDEEDADARKEVDSYREKVGLNIGMFRAYRHMSQVELASASGLTPSTIDALESGKYVATHRTLEMVAKALDIDPSALDPNNDNDPEDTGPDDDDDENGDRDFDDGRDDSQGLDL
jgi:transcriptional regulator with XRE-family HTH domain